MTPLRSALPVLAAGLLTAGGLAAATPGSPAQPRTCSGWTAYAPLHGDDGDAIAEVTDLCSLSAPPEGWPPGAQPAQPSHPEIQIIR